METDTPRRVDTGVGCLILKAVAVLLVGSGAGFAYNAFSDTGIPLRTPPKIRPSDKVDWSLYVEGLRVTLDEAREAFDRKDAVFVDARHPRTYAAGHIPGALNIPLPVDKASVQRVLGDLPKTTRIIAYCGGVSCQSSLALVKALDGFGYTRTKAFYGGWQAWFWANYPTTRGNAP